MISTSRVGVASRAFVPVAAVRASSAAVVARPAAFVAQQGSASWGLRLKSTWASKPIITYEELKPITQQPNDVRSITPYFEWYMSWLTSGAGDSRR